MVCSSGGHLAQLMVLSPWWESKQDVQWVTFDTEDAISVLEGQDVTLAHHPTTRNIRNLVLNFGQALRVLHRTRPELIVSSGAGVAFPYFVAGWMYRDPPGVHRGGRPDRDARPSRVGCVRPFATRFLVQWPSQQPMYKGSEVVGVLL